MFRLNYRRYLYILFLILIWYDFGDLNFLGSIKIPNSIDVLYFVKFTYDFKYPFWDKVLSLYNIFLNKLLISCSKNTDWTYYKVRDNISFGIFAYLISQDSKCFPVSLPLLLSETFIPTRFSGELITLLDWFWKKISFWFLNPH